ncbi:UNVERIFIED_CONTAM: hypothetical protein RMT77_004018 [Armadillidium vulgare]
MSDLKSCLKEAKNAIKDKDYESAVIHCKEALKIDRKCYQALAMFGRACLEQKRFGDSKKALLLATQIDPENPIAWQGLSSLHEKNEHCFEMDEEIAILSHLIQINKEEEKLDRLYRRLASVYQRHERLEDAISVLENLLSLFSNEKQLKEVRKSIIALIESNEELSPELLNKLIENYENLVDESEIGENESNFQSLLRLLYKAKDFEKLIHTSQKMASIFPTAYPLEWIARAFVEYHHYSYSYNEEDLVISEEELLEHLERLIHLYRDSPWGNFAYGLILWWKGNTYDAKQHLKKGCNLLPKNLRAWLTLLNTQRESNDFIGIHSSSKHLNSLLSSSGIETQIPDEFPDVNAVKQFVLLTKVEALFQMGHPNQLEEAVSLLNSVENKSLELRIMFTKSLVHLGRIEEAYQELESVKEEYDDSLSIKRLSSFIAASAGKYEEAKSILQDVLQGEPENAEILLELGKIHYNLKDYKKSLILLLKAAKYNPKLSDSFLYIGHYYRLEDNLEKARKCYEKALSLNPGSEEAGSSLSDVYRITGQNEANLALLLRVTSTGSTGWAWLHLGLHYLAVGEDDDAVKAFQRAVEISPKNRVCYECLGDAYLSRGSHTAALKVFTRVTEMFPNNALYSRCQIARINHLIGKFLLSISQYEEVIGEDPPEAILTVGLVGLAEVLLTRAKIYKQDQLLLNLKSDCMYAIQCLTRYVLYAIQCLTRVASGNANNLTVWKLLGDAMTLQTVLPPSLSNFDVPSRLLDTSVSDIYATTTISKDELLLLGGKCYGVGLQVDKSNASLWHDLGINIFLQGYNKFAMSKKSKLYPDEDKKEIQIFPTDVTQRAMAAIKKSISLDSSDYNAWNSLGVLAYFHGDYALAQHSFITSLKLHATVDAWTHLGTLYFTQDEIHLAHEAFSEAQALDPVYVACWVGQAMVATAVGHYEAFDLFCHTTMLGFHPESCVGFASNVLRITCHINTSDEDDDADPNKDFSSLLPYKNAESYIPNVVDGLTFYTREMEEDAVALNMLGITLETMGLKHSALEAFSKAVHLVVNDDKLDESIRDGIIWNYSRLLIALNKLPEAVKAFSAIKEPDFYTQCGLALAHLKASNFQEAYEKYKEAYEWFASDDAHKSQVMIALAFLHYKFENLEEVKTLLFQSTSVQSLLALASLGLLQKDSTLTDAALVELEVYVDSEEYTFDITFLKSLRTLILEENPKESKLILCRAIHRHPTLSSLWRALARQLILFPSEAVTNVQSQNKFVEGANAAAKVAMSLAQAQGDTKNVVQDVVLRSLSQLQASQMTLPSIQEREKSKKKKKTVVEKTTEIAVPKEERKKLSLKEAQRAILMCPADPSTWAVLIASMDSKSKCKQLARKWSGMANQPLKEWLLIATS